VRTLAIGGTSVAVSGPLASLWVADPLTQPFFDRPGSPVLDLATAPLDPAASVSGRTTFDSGRGWRVSETPTSRRISFFDDHLAPTPRLYQCLTVDREWRAGTLHLPPRVADGRAGEFFLGYPLEQILVMSLLAHGQGAVVHATGIVVNGRGWVFAGTHGAGKSTTATLFSGRRDSLVLNDDRVVVRRSPGGWRVFGTPWAGTVETVSPDSAPLEAILFLRHGERTSARRLRGGEAAVRLLPRCFHPYWDARGVEALLATIGGVVEEVPCYDFPFVRDVGSIASVLDALPA
jgi:hypothetical protein